MDKKQPHSLRKQTSSHQRGKAGQREAYLMGADGQRHSNIHTGHNPQDLLWSTENSPQHSVITYMEKETEEEYIYALIYLNQGLEFTIQ